MAIFLFKDFPTGKVITTFYPNKKVYALHTIDYDNGISCRAD